MEIPSIEHEVIDKGLGVTFKVMAYRKLTDEEAVQFVRAWWTNARKKDRPKRGESLTIYTTASEGR